MSYIFFEMKDFLYFLNFKYNLSIYNINKPKWKNKSKHCLNKLKYNKFIANSTYKYSPNTTNKALILSHSNFILRNLPQKVNEENQCLPSIYWIPKLHRNSSKARFIIAAPKCYLELLLKSVPSALLSN